LRINFTITSTLKAMELLRSLLLLLGSCCLSLALFEGGFRAAILRSQSSGSLEEDLKRSAEVTPVKEQGNVSLAGLIMPSPWREVVYELKPNLNVTFQGKPLRTNRFGLRGNEVELKKPEGVLRIAGIGDSVLFGWGVAEEESYLKVIESTLASRLARQVESLNFGIPGFNTAMEVALLEHKVLQFQPDLVVLHFVSNDFEVPAFMMKREDPLDFSKSFLLEFVRDRLSQPKSKLIHANRIFSANTKKDYDGIAKEYQSMAGKGGAKKALARMSELTKDLPVIVIYGAVTGAQRQLILRSAKKYGWHLLPLGPQVERALKERGIPNTPEERKRRLTVAPNDRHPSALGHEIIAEALAAKVGEVLGS
jgi:lysophospholipase L1-like esterase